MNLLTSFPTTNHSDADWNSVATAVNAWRGRLLHDFAQAEEAVSETLLSLAQDPRRGGDVNLRHLVGQRFQDLQDVLGTGGPFAKEGAAAGDALTTFRGYEKVRTVLCHGSGRISLDRRGRWVLLMRILTFRGRQAERTTHAFEQETAETLGREIAQSSRRLCAVLGQVVGAVGS
ncbi:hypothetical protein [Sphingomonas faeni]|uniref:hypothetical protein n=1 Tax=Sphingomonas faeni TaxID=185950 RepID=UPI00335F8351